MLYDEDLQMTLFSQSLLTDMNCVAANDNGRERVARFPDVNVDITFAYIEGVMAADLTPLKQAYERKRTNATLHRATPTFRRNWTNPQMDTPRDLLSRHKIVKEITNSSIKDFCISKMPNILVIKIHNDNSYDN